MSEYPGSDNTPEYPLAPQPPDKSDPEHAPNSGQGDHPGPEKGHGDDKGEGDHGHGDDRGKGKGEPQ